MQLAVHVAVDLEGVDRVCECHYMVHYSHNFPEGALSSHIPPSAPPSSPLLLGRSHVKESANQRPRQLAARAARESLVYAEESRCSPTGDNSDGGLF